MHPVEIKILPCAYFLTFFTEGINLWHYKKKHDWSVAMMATLIMFQEQRHRWISDCVEKTQPGDTKEYFKNEKKKR